MVRKQRVATTLVASAVLLLAIALGMWLGTVPQQEWEVLLARLQGSHLVSVAPASSTQATLFVLDVDQPVRQEVLVDLQWSDDGYGAGQGSLPVWLTMGLGAVEMPLDNGLALRVELVPGASSDEWSESRAAILSTQIAHR